VGSAYLAPTVRAFLRNGGRRCWVIRVADRAAAQPDTVHLPGILQVDDSGPDGLTLRPAFAWARSEGSWADGIRVTTALTQDARPVQRIEAVAEGGELRLQVADGLRLGDLLRLRFPEAGLTAFMAVERVSPGPAERPAGPQRAGIGNRQIPMYSGRAVWFAPIGCPAGGGSPPAESPPDAAWAATWQIGLSERTEPAVAVVGINAELLQVILAVPLAEAPPPVPWSAWYPTCLPWRPSRCG